MATGMSHRASQTAATRNDEEIVGRAALTVPPGDSDALAAALRTLLEDGSRAAALRSAGPEQVRPFTWARSVERHVVTYRELLA